jgi:hypothetical protein
MSDINQKIEGNNNIQVGGDFIKTEKITRKIEVYHDPDIHITPSQAKEIKDRIEKIAKSRFVYGKSPSQEYKNAYISLYNKFKIPKYTLLYKNQYDDAIKWLDKQIAINRPKLKNVDSDQWRKDMYKTINARATQLGINIHEFATDALELKKPISSLKELSDTRLKKLYNKVFNKKSR